MGKILFWTMMLLLLVMGQIFAAGALLGVYVFFSSIWRKPLGGNFGPEQERELHVIRGGKDMDEDDENEGGDN